MRITNLHLSTKENDMKLTTLTVAILCAASTQVMADNKPYWSGSDGEYARGRDGFCVRTITWTKADSIDGCEGRKAKVKAEPKPAVVEKAEPVKEVKKAESKTATFNLSSGATFELGGSTLSAEGKAEIAGLVSQFEGKSVDSVVIEGHTDSSGDSSFNQQLSEKRAEAVKAELVAQGANGDKISTVGYGESKPIADNATREGRAKNRRVEIKVDGIKQK